MVGRVGGPCYSTMARQRTVIKPASNCNKILQQERNVAATVAATDAPQSRRRGPNDARGEMYYYTWQVLEDTIML